MRVEFFLLGSEFSINQLCENTKSPRRTKNTCKLLKSNWQDIIKRPWKNSSSYSRNASPFRFPRYMKVSDDYFSFCASGRAVPLF